ncbi:MAG: YunC family protein [Candidatus Methanomethyliaceae archaeon]|nr:YunC family protein [Candidatus Methanomethyliaceae archaeon]
MEEKDLMIEISQMENTNAIGIKISVPEAPPLILIRGRKGVIFCGYLNPEVAERVGLAAAIVSGVKTFEEILEKPVVYSTKKAKELGIKPGISGKEALNLLV